MTWAETLLVVLIVAGAGLAAVGVLHLVAGGGPVHVVVDDEHEVPCGLPCGNDECERDWLEDDDAYRRRYDR